MRTGLILAIGLSLSTSAAAESLQLLSQQGRVEVRHPKETRFHAPGRQLPVGSLLRTGPKGQARLRFADGSEVRVRPNSQVKLAAKKGRSSVSLFFGRVWSKVVRSVTGGTSFDVTSANAVAGVRGTEFEVGVAGDGSTRVIVSQGRVDVDGDGRGGKVALSPGQQVDAGPDGRLGRQAAVDGASSWDRWMAGRAMQESAVGEGVAKRLSGRLHRRFGTVRRLRKTQERLRASIQRGLRMGVPKSKIEKDYKALRKVTGRLEDMESRLEAGLGLFANWGTQPGLRESAQLSKLVKDAARLEAEFMDLVEEGTDLSEEGMEDMMKQMPKGPTLKDSGSVKDVLF